MASFSSPVSDTYLMLYIAVIFAQAVEDFEFATYELHTPKSFDETPFNHHRASGGYGITVTKVKAIQKQNFVCAERITGH